MAPLKGEGAGMGVTAAAHLACSIRNADKAAWLVSCDTRMSPNARSVSAFEKESMKTREVMDKSGEGRRGEVIKEQRLYWFHQVARAHLALTVYAQSMLQRWHSPVTCHVVC